MASDEQCIHVYGSNLVITERLTYSNLASLGECQLRPMRFRMNEYFEQIAQHLRIIESTVQYYDYLYKKQAHSIFNRILKRGKLAFDQVMLEILGSENVLCSTSVNFYVVLNKTYGKECGFHHLDIILQL